MVVSELFGAAFRSIGSFFKKGNYTSVADVPKSYADNIAREFNDTGDKLDAVRTHWDDVATKADSRMDGRVSKYNGRIESITQNDLNPLLAKRDKLLNFEEYDGVSGYDKTWRNQQLNSLNDDIVKVQYRIGEQKRKINDAQVANVATKIDAGVGVTFDGLGVAAGGVAGTVGTTTGKAAGDLTRGALWGAGAFVGAGAKAGGATIGLAAKGVGVAAYGTAVVAGKVGMAAAKPVGLAGAHVAKEAGLQAFSAAKFMWNTRDSKVMQLGVSAVGTAVITPMAWQEGVDQNKVSKKVSSNFNVSEDNGGLLMRGGNPAPITEGLREGRYTEQAVQQYEASGDLVFALHNLRNGG